MAAIYGELPDGPVVFAASDSKYFIEHALPFALSASKFGHHVHIHVTNPSPDVFSLASIITATATFPVTYTFDDENISNLTDQEAKAYYACLRFHILPSIIRAAGMVLTLDIDCLVMAEIDLTNMRPCGFFPRPNEGHPAMKVAAGAIFLTSTSLKVAKAISQLLTSLPLQWYVDQFALAKIFDQIPPEHISIFDNSFMDWEFNEGTTIWTGKGPRKYDNPIYLNKKVEFLQEVHKKLSTSRKVLLKPRLDIPFKKLGLAVRNTDPLPEIRQHWQNFGTKFLADFIVEMPRWMFNSTIEDFFHPDSVLLVPHMERRQWGGGKNRNTSFYMQTVFPWLFTIDRIGWGGGAEFVSSFDPTAAYDDKAFNELHKYAINGNSKFPQPDYSDDVTLTSPVVFVPLQIPHDQTIEYHSEITVPEFVKALCEWAEAAEDRPSLLFKGHPVNLESMLPLRDIIRGYKKAAYRENLNIHEVIPAVDAVYVINSGTGQEAMLHDKPVVIFGDSEYQGAVIKGQLSDLDQTWREVVLFDGEYRASLYRRWFHWYLNEVVFDTRLEVSS